MRNYYTGADHYCRNFIALGVGSRLDRIEHARRKRPAVQAPRFEVDPLWPKPLPNHWVVGAVIGVSVDSNDHIWIIHRAGLARSEGTVRDHDAEERGMLRGRSARSRIR